MPSLSLRGADQVGYSWPFELEVYSLCFFEAIASFHHESLSHWVFRSQTHQGRASSSIGDAVSEAPECETENPGLRCKRLVGFGQGSKIRGVFLFFIYPCPKAGASAIASGRGSHSLSQPHSRSSAKVKGPLGKAVEQPLAIMPITVWNPPAKSVRPLSSKVESASVSSHILSYLISF